MHHVTKYSPAKTGEYLRDIPQFLDSICCEKYIKDNKHHSNYLTWKIYLDISFVIGHYMFLRTHNKKTLLFGIPTMFASQNRQPPWTNTQAYNPSNIFAHA